MGTDEKAGTYGEKRTYEDARTTVTEFLDDFYDDSEDNFNQAFLNLERRLQEYFGYERRGSEDLDGEEARDVPDARPWPKLSFVVYNDGAVWARLAHRADAEAVVRAYNGDHNVWFEEEPEEDET